MKDDQKTKKQLIEELKELRQRVAELKGFDDEIEQTRVNQEKFTKAFLQNSIPAGITTLTEGRFVDVSDAFLRLMGRKRDEVIGHTSTELGFITEDQRGSFFNELNKRGRIENLEMKVRTKGGALRYGLFNAVMLSLSNEKYLLTVMTDITERKQAEEKLRQSEARFRSYFDMPLHGIAITSPEQGWLQVNDRICSILGYSRDEIVRMTWAEMTHPDDLAVDVEQFNRILSGQIEQYTIDKRFLRKDGKVIWSSIAVGCVRESDGRVDYIVALMEDITKRKQAEDALRRTEENFRRSVEDSPLGVRIVTTEGETIYANRAILDIYGYESVEDLISTPVKKRYTPESYAEFKIRKEKRKRGDYGPSEYEVSIIRKNGEVRYLQVFRKRVLWGGERQFQVIYQDITERKRAEEDLLKSKQQYDKLVSNVPVGVYTMHSSKNGAFAFDYVSPKLAEIFNVSAESFLADPKVGFKPIHPDDLEALVKLNQDVYQQPQPFNWEGRAIVNDAIKWLRIASSPEMLKNGDVSWHGVVVDITERKQYEEALRENESRTRAMIEAIPDLMFRMDSQGVFLDYVAETSDLYAQSVSTIIGKRNRDITPPNLRI